MMENHSVPHPAGAPESKMPARIPGSLLFLGNQGLRQHRQPPRGPDALGFVGLLGCFFLKLDPRTCMCAHLHSSSEYTT